VKEKRNGTTAIAMVEATKCLTYIYMKQEQRIHNLAERCYVEKKRGDEDEGKKEENIRE
jgi:hypothetical protein